MSDRLNSALLTLGTVGADTPAHTFPEVEGRNLGGGESLVKKRTKSELIQRKWQAGSRAKVFRKIGLKKRRLTHHECGGYEQGGRRAQSNNNKLYGEKSE